MTTDPAIYSAFASPTPESPQRAESILEILWRRKQTILVVFLLCVMTAAAVVQVVPKKWSAESRVMITRGPAGDENKVDDTATFLNTQCELIRSAAVLSQAMDAPGMQSITFLETSDNQIEFLKEHLDVRPRPGTAVIAIRLASRDPEEAKTIVNAVAQAYVAYVADQKTRNSSVELYSRIADDRKKLDQDRMLAKQHLLSLQAETRGSATTNPADNFAAQKLRQVSDALNDAQLNTLKIKTQYEAALQTLGMSLDKVDEGRFENATAVSPQSLPLLASNLLALQQQMIEAKRQFVPTHPAVRSLRKQIADLQLSQAATLKNAFANAQSHERETRDLFVNQQQASHNVDAKANELAMTQDRLNYIEHEVGVLDSKLQQLQNTESLGFDARQFEQAAIDTNSAQPDPAKTIGYAAIIGLVLGMMAALAREWVSPSLGSPSNVADRVGVPVLGTLPRVNGRGGRELARITQDASDSEAAEAFRSIRTSMLFGAGQSRTVTITSPAGKDGKTTLAANLAISLAQSGKRVALIDANFRDPFVHTAFDMDNVIGLTSVLDGDDLESSLRRTAIEHLDVLTAGPKSDGASEKLNSARFLELVRDLSMRYDHVIFDTPAVAGSNDARVIAAGCDQTILVVRGERSNRFATTTARDALLSVGAQLMGIVMNDWQRVSQAYPAGVERAAPPATGTERSQRLARARDRR